jgi:hypothetical protein
VVLLVGIADVMDPGLLSRWGLAYRFGGPA